MGRKMVNTQFSFCLLPIYSFSLVFCTHCSIDQHKGSAAAFGRAHSDPAFPLEREPGYPSIPELGDWKMGVGEDRKEDSA